MSVDPDSAETDSESCSKPEGVNIEFKADYRQQNRRRTWWRWNGSGGPNGNDGQREWGVQMVMTSGMSAGRGGVWMAKMPATRKDSEPGAQKRESARVPPARTTSRHANLKAPHAPARSEEARRRTEERNQRRQGGDGDCAGASADGPTRFGLLQSQVTFVFASQFMIGDCRACLSLRLSRRPVSRQVSVADHGHGPGVRTVQCCRVQRPSETGRQQKTEEAVWRVSLLFKEEVGLVTGRRATPYEPARSPLEFIEWKEAGSRYVWVAGGYKGGQELLSRSRHPPNRSL